MLAGHVRQESHLVLPGAGPFVMVQMARIVTDFVHPRGHHRRQAVVLLKIDRKIGLGSLANLAEGLAIGLGIDGQSARCLPPRRPID